MDQKINLEGFTILDDTRGLLIKASHRLHAHFKEQFSLETIEQYIFESYELLDAKSEIKIYLPSLTERFAKDRLHALLKSAHPEESDTIDILFVCVHNSGRSQMAEGFMAQLGGDRVVVRSAGSAPRATLSAEVIHAMAEVGIDIRQEFPKPLTDEIVRASDAVITMGCGDACPVYPGKLYQDWEIENPADQSIDVVRVIRDEIEKRVEALLAELISANR